MENISLIDSLKTALDALEATAGETENDGNPINDLVMVQKLRDHVAWLKNSARFMPIEILDKIQAIRDKEV